MKISHEAPKSIFNLIANNTDYDYALVHLFETDLEYWDQFADAKWLGREIILDNSVFELETEFDSDRFYYWVQKLRPTWYIIPDKLEDKDKTIQNIVDWKLKYTCDYSKSIGVVQGKTYEEVVECYNRIVDLVDKVAISFDYSFFSQIAPDAPTKYHQYMIGRQIIIKRMLDEGVINTTKPHHLLGCGLPQEFLAYKGYDWIDSVDTSNPVVHGMNLIKYGDSGLEDKIKTKLIEYIDDKVTDDQLDTILHNVEKFRSFCK